MEKEYFELTNPQKSIWLTNQMYPDTPIENICGSVFIDDKVNFIALQKAINCFVEKNDSFRMEFEMTENGIRQFVSHFAPFNIEIIKVNFDSDVNRIEKNLVAIPFPLTNSLLFQFKMFEFPNGHGGFTINAHHLISDAWTAGLVVNEIVDYYAYFNHISETVEEEFPSYLEYIHSEKEYLQSDRFQKDEEFWLDLYKTIPEVARIPNMKNSTSSTLSCHAARKLFNISAKTIASIQEYCTAHRVSIFNFFMAVYSLYVSRTSGLEEFVIGTPILNRTTFKEKHTTGMFISTVPFKISIGEDYDFSYFVNTIAKNALSIFRHQKYPYPYLLEHLRKQDSSIPNLYDFLISYQNVRSDKQTSQVPYHARWISNDCLSDGMNVHLYDMNDTGSLDVAYDYLLSRYEEEEIQMLHTRILYIIDQVLANPSIALNDIEIVTPEEKKMLLYDFNNTKIEYDENKTISMLFEEQVEKTPDAVALVFENQKMTYRQLNEKANELANILANNKVNPKDVVAILFHKSLESIVSILAVLKVGATYLPIDIDYPTDRIDFILKDSNAKIIITSSLYEKLYTKALPSIVIDDLSNISGNSTFVSNRDATCPAYIMYTSGSTGTPKGVIIAQKSILRLVQSPNYITFSDHERILQTGSIVFDACTFEIWASLLHGFELYLIPKEKLLSPSDFANYLKDNKISILWLTAPLFNQLSETEPSMFEHVKYLLTGGDVLSPKHINIVKSHCPNLTIINGYGPTENTTFSTCFTIDKNYLTNIPIGFPISNSTCYIVDKHLGLLPIGTPGELLVGGDGVGLGYLNNIALTHEKFIPNPFGTDTLYKTGDLVRWLPNGAIEFIGRIDNQVKIRGFRVELNEINLKIKAYPNIKDSITIIRTIHNQKFICAYITSDTKISISDLKAYLKYCLPPYMVPTYMMQLEKLPINYNGKVDKSALPVPTLVKNTKDFILPKNALEQDLYQMVKEILGLDAFSMQDSFFELGGDSLNAIHLCMSISSKLGYRITVKEIMEHPMLLDLAEFLDEQKQKESNVMQITKAPKSKYYPVSSAQKRIYYSTKKVSEQNTLYNVTGGLLVNTLLDITQIRNSIQKLVDVHSSFRTQFEQLDSSLVQTIVDNVAIQVPVYYDTECNLRQIVNHFPKPFDLSKAPLLRVAVYYLDHQKTLILIDTHHSIMDGASLNIFMQDFCHLYNGQTLDIPELEYTDYAVWENDYIEKSKDIKEFETYWHSLYDGCEIPVLNLPYDFPISSAKSYIGNTISYTVSEEFWSKLESFSKNQNVSANVLFLTALYVLLYQYTGETNLIIGSPIEGRYSKELTNIIGMFVNMVALRSNLDPNLSLADFLQNVSALVIEALSNQPYPYELLLKNLKIPQDTSLLDIVLTYQNNQHNMGKIDNQTPEIISSYTHSSKFNIWLEIVPNNRTIHLEYNSALFKQNTMANFLEHYLFVLEQMVTHPNLAMKEMEILTPKEKDLLKQFNATDGPINDDTIASIFEDQVRLHPNDIALICNDVTLTYDELNKKANSLAHLLIQKGIKANDIVCIMTNRSLETVICMLAILKAGAAFFNVDPNYPIDRTKYYIEDSKTRYVLTQSDLKQQVKNIENCIEIDLNKDEIYQRNVNNPHVKIAKEDLSYLIYTSGSTGKPKGVMLNQVGLANMTKAMTLVLDYLKEGNKHCIASVTSTPFDIFVYEIIVSLTHGLKVVMANNAEHRSPKLLDALIRKHHVDVMTVTPSLMKINYDNREPDTALANVKNMVFGGEPLPEKFVEDLRALADDITIYNIYGPSEITILSNVQNLNGESEITIGPPIMNTQIHILDKNQRPVPIGVVGEIYISGIQVGCGYMNRPELTAEKFMENPFGSGKMYKSGDIGRWTFDGKVQCLGRIDNQIKLRGLRIELGEIENVLLNINGIISAVVNKVEIDNKEFLCAYYVCHQTLDESTIKEILRKKLPNYMVPTYLVRLDEMPYTINRKIDRKALPLPTFNKPVVNSHIDIENLNSDEEKLLQIWKNILKIDEISINDNFFDIGGDSVAAISMQIEAVKYGLEFEYSDIFSFPTIKQLSGKINSSDTRFMEHYDFTKINEVLSRNVPENLSTIKEATVNNILLIGSTGFLGAHILDCFLRDNTGDIYCLVRKKNNIDIEQRLKDTLHFYFGNQYDSFFGNRIKIVLGDITSENLGLSNEDYSILKNNIDTIINSGALVKHFGLKKKFYDINVVGTKNIIDFCLKEKKRLLHISTISVSGNGEKEETVVETAENKDNKKIFKESDIYIGQNIKGVYTTTKFEAELCVLEAISNGLDAQILRLGNITNRYSDGLFQSNVNENAFAKRIKSFIEIGAFPDYMLEHAIELTPVDLAAEAIIRILNHTSICNVFHISDTKLLQIPLLVETLHLLGIKLIPVPEIMMKDILTGILADNSRKDILSGIIYDLDNHKRLVYTSNIRLNSTFTESYLNKLGFQWSDIDQDYIKRYMQYFNKIHFID